MLGMLDWSISNLGSMGTCKKIPMGFLNLTTKVKNHIKTFRSRKICCTSEFDVPKSILVSE